MRYFGKSNATDVSLWRREVQVLYVKNKPNWIKVNRITFKLKPMETGYSRRAAASRMSDARPSNREMTLAAPKVSEDRDRSAWLMNAAINTSRTSAQMPILISRFCFYCPTIEKIYFFMMAPLLHMGGKLIFVAFTRLKDNRENQKIKTDVIYRRCAESGCLDEEGVVGMQGFVGDIWTKPGLRKSLQGACLRLPFSPNVVVWLSTTHLLF